VYSIPETEEEIMTNDLNRRDFIKTSSAAALSAAALGAVEAKAQQKEVVRVGVVGVGARGTGIVQTLLDIPGVEIPAICDINVENLERSLKNVADKAGNARKGIPEGRAISSASAIGTISTRSSTPPPGNGTLLSRWRP
jgi:hypothetical protein